MPFVVVFRDGRQIRGVRIRPEELDGRLQLDARTIGDCVKDAVAGQDVEATTGTEAAATEWNFVRGRCNWTAGRTAETATRADHKILWQTLTWLSNVAFIPTTATSCCGKSSSARSWGRSSFEIHR